MRKLPFAEHGFHLYDRSEATDHLKRSGFRVLRTLLHEEDGESNAGESVRKKINIIICAT